MKRVEPKVRIIGRPEIDWDQIEAHLMEDVEASGQWAWDREQATGEEEVPDGEALVEFAGRKCYRSFEVGLNPNVTRIREDREAYINNILESRHGSVLEHVNFTFTLHNVSRVLTHELVRHRAGVAYSQESLRYVRLTEIPMWGPQWVEEDPEAMARVVELVGGAEEFQRWGANHWGLDESGTSFHKKKEVTSFLRRLAPEGLATSLVMTANVRALRHIIEVRTAKGAEEEIRLVANQIGWLMAEEVPFLFGDFGGTGEEWVPKSSKV